MTHILAPALVVLCFTAAPALAQETFGRTSLARPVNVSNATKDIDMMYAIIWWLTTVVFLAVFVMLIVFLVKYRHQPGRRATYIHGNPRLEIVWTLVPTVIMVLIAVFSQSIWAKYKYIDQMPSGEDVVEVKVTGRQFQWFFHYPGADGKFGKIDPLWRRNTGDPGEEVGLMRGDVYDFLDESLIEQIEQNEARAHLLEADDAAQDDVVTSVMYAPVDRKVHIELTSVDVLHSFFLPYFRIKQDAVPGLMGHLWIEANMKSADVIGQFADGSPKPYDIICAELCGAQHYKMRGQLFVVDEEDYQQWLIEQAPEIEEEEEEEEEEDEDEDGDEDEDEED